MYMSSVPYNRFDCTCTMECTVALSPLPPFQPMSGRPEPDTQKQTKPVSNGIKPSVLDLSEPVKPVFAPVFLANSSQPCQCSACVGAMAANITEVRDSILISERCPVYHFGVLIRVSLYPYGNGVCV